MRQWVHLSMAHFLANRFSPAHEFALTSHICACTIRDFFPYIGFVVSISKGANITGCTLLAMALSLVPLGLAQDSASQSPDAIESPDVQESPKEQCKQFLAEKKVWDKGIQEAVTAMNQSIVVKHAAFWVTGTQSDTLGGSEAPHLTEAQQAELTDDLDKLLDIVWQIEVNVVRKLYTGPEHARRFSHLRAKLDPESDMGAWACFDTNTIQISPLLIKNIWINSVREQTSGGFEPDIRSQEQLLDAIHLPKPPDVTYQEFLDNTENAIRGEKYNGLKMAANGLVKLASIDYMKALLFLLSHEAAHHWLDRCPPYGVTISSETRADDYGLLISSSWLGEQFNFAQREAQAANLKRKLIRQAKEDREKAKKRLRINSYPIEPGFFDPDKLSDQQTAKESDAAIERRIDQDLPPKTDAPFSLGRLGFETFVDVYEKAGLREYVEGNSTHPPMAVRLKRLEHGYASENLVGKNILLERLGTERALQRLVEKMDQKRADTMLESFLTPLIQNTTASYPECDNLH
jgi:hypothetical protein